MQYVAALSYRVGLLGPAEGPIVPTGTDARFPTLLAPYKVGRLSGGYNAVWRSGFGRQISQFNGG